MAQAVSAGVPVMKINMVEKFSLHVISTGMAV